MEKLKKQIQSSRDIRESSADMYVKSLNSLHKKMFEGPMKDIQFLSNTKNVLDNLSRYKLTTQRNKLIAAIVALTSQSKPNKDALEKYNSALKEMNKEYNSRLQTQKKTPTQEKNWLEYDQLIKIANDLMTEAKPILKKDSISLKELDTIRQLVALRVYLIFTVRNDFADMKIVSQSEYDNIPKSTKAKNNYLVEKSGNSRTFKLNNFKNSKSIGAKEFDVPKHVNKIISKWLKFNQSGYFLTSYNNNNPISPNGITKLMNRIFEPRTGKSISTSMLRHIIISHDMKDKPTIEEKKEQANNIENKYLHSKSMNELYRKV